MSTDVEDKDLGELHQDLIRAFERIRGLADNAELLGVHRGATAHDAQFLRVSLEAQLESVRNLELIMPIVAPMKAGKSTLVNAIVGYQLLPARANPMTTLPTKIVLVEGMDLNKPQLYLPESLRRLFQTLETQVRAVMLARWPVPREHGYLDELATLLKADALAPLQEWYEGTAEVHAVLARLNDEMRLAALAIGDEDFLGGVRELPELRTGHVHSFAAGAGTGGRLVIIDTPGPNEYAIAARLGPALERQLAESHVVLVVLDYTQMGGEAAADIRNRLGRHLEIIGTSRLYAVVNKVDARKTKDDLSKADTREAVRHSLGLTAEQADRQLFEAVANWGLLGSRVLAEIDAAGERFAPSDSEAARSVLRELYPLDDDEELTERLAETDTESLRIDARRFLRKSHVAELVDTAIARLRRGAAPAVMSAGIKRFEAAAGELAELIALERSAADRGSEIVAQQLAALESEIALLQGHRDARPSPEQLQRRFQAELTTFVRELEGHGQHIIRMLEVGREQQHEASGGWEPVRAIRRGLTGLFDKLFHDKPQSDEHSFPTEDGANRFKDQLAGAVTEQLHQLLDVARYHFEKRVGRLTATIVAEQESKVRELIERAAETLSSAFDVKLQPPPPAVVNGKLSSRLEGARARTTTHEQEVETIERRRVWYKLWIGKRDVKVKTKKTVSVTTYVVSRSDVMRQLSAAFSTQVKGMEVQLTRYVGTTLSAELSAYYQGLDDYLKRYHGALTRSQRAGERDEAQQRERRDALTKLEASLQQELDGLLEYRERLPQTPE
ncbi:dynamin family protein [Dactylosporangium sucinum]|uniref:dynamin family protein n=1 Tax=Dactylosporangium sucinum TaxID=1424081 RepID=UPI00167DC6E9|nr:dynamin family protein [Dactylosporangium sucinum]